MDDAQIGLDQGGVGLDKGAIEALGALGAAADDEGGYILFLERYLPILVGLFFGDGEHFLADGQAG